MSNSLRPHRLQRARLLYPLWSCRGFSNSCLWSQWCHPTISFSAAPFFCLQSFPASKSFPMSWLFISGGQGIGASASASVLSVNIQGWRPLGLTGLISLQSKGLSGVFSGTIDKHQLFSPHIPTWFKSHIPTWLLEKPNCIKAFSSSQIQSLFQFTPKSIFFIK